MTIDTKRLETDAAYWDKVAPLGATHHWEPSGEWYQDCGDYALSWSFGAGKWLRAVLPLRIARPEAIPRPTKPAESEWDGESFPVPIGEKCECTFSVENHDTWHKGKVVFHGIDPEGREYIVVDTDVYQACFRSMDHIRPIRTQEQRERDELIELAFSTVQKIPSTESAITAVVDAIIAAGWTKP